MYNKVRLNACHLVNHKAPEDGIMLEDLILHLKGLIILGAYFPTKQTRTKGGDVSGSLLYCKWKATPSGLMDMKTQKKT